MTSTHEASPLMQRAAAARGMTIPEYQRLRKRWRLQDIAKEIGLLEAGLAFAKYPTAIAGYEERIGALREEATAIEWELDDDASRPPHQQEEAP